MSNGRKNDGKLVVTSRTPAPGSFIEVQRIKCRLTVYKINIGCRLDRKCVKYSLPGKLIFSQYACLNTKHVADLLQSSKCSSGHIYQEQVPSALGFNVSPANAKSV